MNLCVRLNSNKIFCSWKLVSNCCITNFWHKNFICFCYSFIKLIDFKIVPNIRKDLEVEAIFCRTLPSSCHLHHLSPTTIQLQTVRNILRLNYPSIFYEQPHNRGIKAWRSIKTKIPLQFWRGQLRPNYPFNFA